MGNAPGLLAGASDRDQQTPDTDSLSVDGALVEQPRHGTVSVNDATGAWVYQPAPGFTGRDWFTWQVDDGLKHGGYSTVFIDVTPLTIAPRFDGF